MKKAILKSWHMTEAKIIKIPDSFMCYFLILEYDNNEFETYLRDLVIFDLEKIGITRYKVYYPQVLVDSSLTINYYPNLFLFEFENENDIVYVNFLYNHSSLKSKLILVNP